VENSGETRLGVLLKNTDDRVMQMLRRLVRSYFGLQAVGLLAAPAIFLGVMRGSAERVSSAPLPFVALVTILLVAAVSGVPAIAWWQGRKHAASARGWALAASLLNVVTFLAFAALAMGRASRSFTVFAVDGAAGLAGLLAFWQEDSTPPPLPKKKLRIAGDGTSKWKDYAGVALSVAIFWFGYGAVNRWGAAHGFAQPGFLLWIAQVEVANLVSTALHECGHLIAGKTSGMLLRSFQVGPFHWVIRNGKWRFGAQWNRFYGGSCGMVSPALKHLRSNTAFMIMGGPAASLVTASIAALAALSAPGHPWQPLWLLFGVTAIISGAGFIVNLIPQKPESQYSDGAQLVQLVTNGPWARVHLALATSASSIVTRLRPRDFDIAMLASAADAVTEGERAFILRLLCAHYYFDRGRIPEALAFVDEAEPLFEHCTFASPADICAEFVFLQAFYKRDLRAANLWNERLHAVPHEKDAEYWRARTALLWLEGDRAGARQAWDAGYTLAHALPNCGAYDFTRSSFDRIREEMDRPAGLAALAAAVEEQSPGPRLLAKPPNHADRRRGLMLS
jgi:hypothetical protein